MEAMKSLEIKNMVEKVPEVKTDKISIPVPFKNEFEIGKLLKTAGTVKLTEVQRKTLYSPVKDEDIEIRPDGMIYLPWVDYADRLHKAFGMEWALIPQGMPKLEGNLVMWGFYIIIKGSLMAYAVGGQEYFQNNRKMNWADATEGAKSNALMRLCKEIGIANQLWKPTFIRNWKLKYAESYPSKDKNGDPITLWRRKSVPKKVEPENKTEKNINPKIEKLKPENKANKDLNYAREIKAIHMIQSRLKELDIDKYTVDYFRTLKMKKTGKDSSVAMSQVKRFLFLQFMEKKLINELKERKPPV